MASAGLRDDDGCIHATSRKALKTRRLQKQTSSMHAIPSRRSKGVVLGSCSYDSYRYPGARILRGRGIFHCPWNPFERISRGGVGSRSDPAPRDSSSPVSSLLTVIEWYFELTSKWQGPGNQDTTHPAIPAEPIL